MDFVTLLLMACVFGLGYGIGSVRLKGDNK